MIVSPPADTYPGSVRRFKLTRREPGASLADGTSLKSLGCFCRYSLSVEPFCPNGSADRSGAFPLGTVPLFQRWKSRRRHAGVGNTGESPTVPVVPPAESGTVYFFVSLAGFPTTDLIAQTGSTFIIFLSNSLRELFLERSTNLMHLPDLLLHLLQMSQHRVFLDAIL